MPPCSLAMGACRAHPGSEVPHDRRRMLQVTPRLGDGKTRAAAYRSQGAMASASTGTRTPLSCTQPGSYRPSIILTAWMGSFLHKILFLMRERSSIFSAFWRGRLGRRVADECTTCTSANLCLFSHLQDADTCTVVTV